MDMLTCTYMTWGVQKRMDTDTRAQPHVRTSIQTVATRGDRRASCSAPARACPALSISEPMFLPSAVSITFLTSPLVLLDPSSIPFLSLTWVSGAGLGMELWWRQRRADAGAGLCRAGLGLVPMRSGCGQALGSPVLSRKYSKASALGALPQRMLLPRSGSAPAPAQALRQL